MSARRLTAQMLLESPVCLQQHPEEGRMWGRHDSGRRGGQGSGRYGTWFLLMHSGPQQQVCPLASGRTSRRTSAPGLQAPQHCECSAHTASHVPCPLYTL